MADARREADLSSALATPLPLPPRQGLRHLLFRELFSPLAGMTLPAWWRLLADNQFRVAPRYLPRAAFVTAHAAVNSVLAPLESAAAPSGPPPLFVLGHWRSGTTWLQTLLAADPRHATPDFWQVLYPHTARVTARWLPWLVGPWLPTERPTDRLPMGLDAPMEDEFAIAALSGVSPYLAWSFPAREAHYRRHLTLRDADTDERQRWKDALRAVVSRAGSEGQRVVLKSPAHTGRVRTILEVFPDARFVFLHRHPSDVYRSTMRLEQQGVHGLRLQQGDDGAHERVVWRYRALHDAWFDDRDQIPAGRCVELAFHDLASRPLGVLERLYGALDLGDPAPTRAAVAHIVASQPHRPTAHDPLDPALEAQLREHWAEGYAAWGVGGA